MKIASFNVGAFVKVTVSVFGALFLGAANFAKASGFDISCALPFDVIKVHHPIDDSCAKRGDVPDPPIGDNEAAHASQNSAKNNYCASGGPALITFATFARLQKKLDQKFPAAKTWGRTHLPEDRSMLAAIYTTSAGDTIGEGNVVRLVAWVMKPRKGGAESVNCQGTKNEQTDLHIVLISSSDRESTPECSSVTAEISPHFRPEKWDAHTILLANDHPLRLTGHLMYDASHRPCSGTPPKAGHQAPARVSSWEIHPVYGVDVCIKKSIKSCKANDESLWVPLDQWEGDEG